MVCKEHKEALEAAWEEDQEIQHMRELEVCENNTFGLWSEKNVLFNDALREGKGRETVFTCLYPNTVQTRLSRDQRPTKPVSRLGTGMHSEIFEVILYQVGYEHKYQIQVNRNGTLYRSAYGWDNPPFIVH